MCLTGGKNNLVYYDDSIDLVYKVYSRPGKSLDAALNAPDRMVAVHNQIHANDPSNSARVVDVSSDSKEKRAAFCSPFVEGKVLTKMTFEQAQQVERDMWRVYREHGYVILDAATVREGAGNVKLDQAGQVKWLDLGLALRRGDRVSDEWYVSAVRQVSSYFKDDPWSVANATDPATRLAQANVCVVRNIAQILYLSEEGLLHGDHALSRAPGNMIPNRVIDEWRQLDRTELKWLRQLLYKICNPYTLSPISRTHLLEMTRNNIQLAEKWISVRLFSETLPARWQAFCALPQVDRDALHDCQAVLERFAGGMPDVNLSKLQSEHAITSEFIHALKAGCDYLDRHGNRCCNPFSYHGRHGRNATLNYLQLLLLGDRQPATIIPLMSDWVADKPFYSGCFSDSGAREDSRAAFVWASGLVRIEGAAIPNRATAWTRLRPEQRRAALTIMQP